MSGYTVNVKVRLIKSLLLCLSSECVHDDNDAAIVYIFIFKTGFGHTCRYCQKDMYMNNPNCSSGQKIITKFD